MTRATSPCCGSEVTVVHPEATWMQACRHTIARHVRELDTGFCVWCRCSGCMACIRGGDARQSELTATCNTSQTPMLVHTQALTRHRAQTSCCMHKEHSLGTGESGLVSRSSKADETIETASAAAISTAAAFLCTAQSVSCVHGAGSRGEWL
jgi:hypothetical protein